MNLRTAIVREAAREAIGSRSLDHYGDKVVIQGAALGALLEKCARSAIENHAQLVAGMISSKGVDLVQTDEVVRILRDA